MRFKLLLFALVYSMQAGAVSIEDDTCFQENAHFISHYFSVEGAPPPLLDGFFDCIDNLIQLFLNHTPYHRKMGYYTQTELRRAIQYMVRGVSKAEAEEMSQALLNLKTGFIGGDSRKVTTQEIAVFRKILYVFRRRMRSSAPAVFTLVRSIKGQSSPADKEIFLATDMLTTNLISMGSLLSKISFSSDLSVLEGLPQSLSVLGIPSRYLTYWKSSLMLLRKWKNMFFASPEHIIQSAEWPVLLTTFSQIIRLWFYYQKFLKSQPLLTVDTVSHTQYFLSYSLNMFSKRLADKKDISLTDIDELARQIWFLPYMSRPLFRLAVRSVFCFLLNPITHSKPCRHSMDFQSDSLKISFSDLTFSLTETGELYESRSGGLSDRIQPAHLRVLKQYVNSWIISENHIKKSGRLLPLFGSPHKWLGRKINVAKDGRLLFYADKKNESQKALLSRLNWQSHLMKFVTSAYTKREKKPVHQKLWNKMIQEWTALSGAFYKDIKWRRFQKVGFQVFRHADFLTSYSNGDAVLQEEEILEVFSFFMSSLTVTLSSLKDRPGCMRSANRLQSACVWSYLRSLPSKVFVGWPQLFKTLSEGQNYLSRLSSFYQEAEEISIKDLFEIFLFMHYQENAMLRLDKDFSQSLSLRELEPLLNVFEQTLIENTPLIYTKTSALAFGAYIFYYGQVPAFSQNYNISAPLHFSNWFLQPKKWQQVKVDREKMLESLFLIKNLNN